MIYTTQYLSPFGPITLACDNEALIGLWFASQRPEIDLTQAVTPALKPSLLELSIHWLNLYFSGRDPGFLPPLSYNSTPFRNRVWDILLRIPFGKTMTYGEIGQILAKERGLEKMSAQAVGGAVGHNPIALMIPCHRVVGTNGKLTGYAGGLDLKAKLLALEGSRFC